MITETAFGKRDTGEPKSGSWRLRLLTVALLLVVVAVLVLGTVEPASAASEFENDELEFDDPVVTDVVDRDGDGRVSSFTVRWRADTLIRDGTVGKRDIPENYFPTITEGQPKFALFGIVPVDERKQEVMLGLKQVNRHEEMMTVEMQVQLRDQAEERDIWIDDKEIRELDLMYVESDSSPDALVLKDVDTLEAVENSFTGVGKAVGGVILVGTGAVPTGAKTLGSAGADITAVGRSIDRSWSSDDHVATEHTVLSEPIRLEKPSNDRLDEVEITSNVDGADVYVDGDRVGTAPLTEEYPVDYSERGGPVTVRVNADGYVSEARSLDVEPPQTVEFTLEKDEKPIVVNAEPSDSSVYIDGEFAGEPPVEHTTWVKDSVDVTVEHDDYVNEEFEDVSPPRTIDVTLLDTDQLDPTPGDPIGDVGELQPSPLPDDIYFDLNLEGAFWADFDYAPETAHTGESISFDGTHSTNLGGDIVEYEWDFGDGNSATEPQPVHTYADPGTYTVSLTVTDEADNTTSVEEDITVANAPPTAEFLVSTTSTVTGQSVMFDATTSEDPEDSILRYGWDVDGDGTSEMSGQRQSVTHTYASPGTYDVELTVTDNAGQTSTATTTVTVETPNEPPQPSVEVSATETTVDEQVTFDASSSTDPDGKITSYNWEFGDGTQTNGETVTHSYESEGTYEVALLVVDDGNELATTETTVDVTSSDGDEDGVESNGDGEDGDGTTDGSEDEPDGDGDTTQENEAQSDEDNTDESEVEGGDDGDDGEDGEDGGGGSPMPGFGLLVTLVGVLTVLFVRAKHRE